MQEVLFPRFVEHDASDEELITQHELAHWTVSALERRVLGRIQSPQEVVSYYAALSKLPAAEALALQLSDEAGRRGYEFAELAEMN